jgi:transposase
VPREGLGVGRERASPSDLTDEQWEIIEPMLPLIKEPGRIPKRPFRDIVDAILYIDRSGCSWRQLPVDFPPWQTVYGWFRRSKERGVTDRILAELREQIRLVEGREPEPSAGVIDSQSVRGAYTVGADTRGYDAVRRSTGISDSSSPIPSACWSASRSSPRPDRTATAPGPPCSGST